MWCNKFYRIIILALAFILSVPSLSKADASHLLPMPQQYAAVKGMFSTSSISLKSDFNDNRWAPLLLDMGWKITPNSLYTIFISRVEQLNGVTQNVGEAYRLTVQPKYIKIQATTATGVLRALQTLQQLTYKKQRITAVDCCSILDWPAFSIRGFMQDVGRSYISLAELKREINILSKFKINVFHWHLTENQAWRLQSKKYPQLTAAENMTRMPGKFYTLDDAKDLENYCEERGVMLIPEIDMPGHSAAFERCFKVSMQSEKGMVILKDIIDEVCQTFRGPYLHIGTDEVKFTNANFVPEMIAYVRSKGKKVISWNPGWHYKAGEIDMTQLWSSHGAAQDGITSIDSRLHYLNHCDTFADLFSFYSGKVYNREKEDNQIKGMIAAVWNDRLLTDEYHIVLENNLYSNMLALAERTWRGGGWQYFDKSGTVLPLPSEKEHYTEFKKFETRLLWHKDHTFKGYPFAYVKQTQALWNITDAFPNDGDLKKVFPPETQKLQKSYMYEGKMYATHLAVGSGIYLRHTWGKFVPAFYKDPQTNHTAYAFTQIYAPRDMEVGLFAEFQNYSRSEADLPPKQGTWDYRGSRMWINGNEIMPPHWTDTTKVKSMESLLGNENFTARKPILVKLHKGLNKVFLKLPVGQFSIPEIRLMKWMFTVAFVTPDGSKAVDELKYIPL